MNRLSEITERIKGTSAEPWEWSKFCKPNGGPIKTIEDLIDILALSARKSDSIELWGVTLEENDGDSKALVVCYTGNGPHSGVNSKFIAHSRSDIPYLLERILDAETILKKIQDESIEIHEVEAADDYFKRWEKC
jgi:hypothetical protein